jgi:hypothetical protein
MMNPHSPPPEDEPEDLLPLTIKNVALALLSLLLCVATSVPTFAYMMVSCVVLQQGVGCREGCLL